MPLIQEFTAPGAEVVTAAMTFPQVCGEHYGQPVTVGYYPGTAEVWIESDGGRLNIGGEHLNGFIRQLRRAHRMALEKVE